MDDEELRAVFEGYARASNTLDVDTIAPFFADVCMAAAPGFVGATTSRKELRAALEQIVGFYRTIGRGDMRISSITAQPLGVDADAVLSEAGYTRARSMRYGRAE